MTATFWKKSGNINGLWMATVDLVVGGVGPITGHPVYRSLLLDHARLAVKIQLYPSRVLEHDTSPSLIRMWVNEEQLWVSSCWHHHVKKKKSDSKSNNRSMQMLNIVSMRGEEMVHFSSTVLTPWSTLQRPLWEQFRVQHKLSLKNTPPGGSQLRKQRLMFTHLVKIW